MIDYIVMLKKTGEKENGTKIYSVDLLRGIRLNNEHQNRREGKKGSLFLFQASADCRGSGGGTMMKLIVLGKKAYDAWEAQ